MQTVTLMPEETEALRQLLQHALTEMDVEVHRTDNLDYKRMLKSRRDAMEQILLKLGPLPTAAAA